MTSADQERIDRLDNYLDALAAGNSAQPHDLDPVQVETLDRLFARDDAPAPPPELTKRIGDELMNQAIYGGTIPLRTITLAPAASNGRALPRLGQMGADAGNIRILHSRFVRLAIAAIVLLSLGIGYAGYDRFGNEPSGPATIPAVVAPAATPDATSATPVGTATVTVKLFNRAYGTPVKSACFAAVQVLGPGRIEFLQASGCDEDDGADDGTTTVAGIPAGPEVKIYATSLGQGQGQQLTYSQPVAQSVRAEPGATASVFFETGPNCGYPGGDTLRCTVVSIRESSGIDPAESVCYAIFLTENDAPGAFYTAKCDVPAAGAIRAGIVEIKGFRPGSYQLVRIDQTGAPLGNPMPLLIEAQQNQNTPGEEVVIDWHDE